MLSNRAWPVSPEVKPSLYSKVFVASRWRSQSLRPAMVVLVFFRRAVVLGP